MRTTSSTRSASPLMSGRQDGTSATTSSPAPATAKPSASSISELLLVGDIDAGKRLHAVEPVAAPKIPSAAHAPAITSSDASPPQSSSIMSEAISAPGSTKAGSTPRSKRKRASETMPSLRPGRRRADRIEISGLEEDVLRLRAAAGRLAADDAGDPFRTGIVGDHRHLAVERVGLAVERLNRLAVARETRVDRALHLVSVEDVERTAVGSW